jgi:hypothetical protein
VGGVDTVQSMIEASEWWEDIQVSFAEEGNYVKILGGWLGDKEDIFTGKSVFIESDRLWKIIEHNVQTEYNEYCEDRYREDKEPLDFAKWQSKLLKRLRQKQK